MHINNIGYNHCHDADFCIQRPDGSGDYLLLLIKTPAVFTFSETDTFTEANSFILYKEGTPQFYRAYGTQFSNDWFHFKLSSGDFDFFDALDIPFDKVVKLDDINGLSLIIKNMAYESYSSNMFKTDSAELYMKLFFIKLSEEIHSFGGSRSSTHYDKMALLRSQIYNMPYNEWNVDGLSHQLAMSKSYFQHLYKQFFHCSCSQDIINARLLLARYYLTSSDMSIRNLADFCGYENELHFMRQFKKFVGMTPSQYRKVLPPIS